MFGVWKIDFTYRSPRTKKCIRGEVFFLVSSMEEALRMFNTEWGALHPTIVDIETTE